LEVRRELQTLKQLLLKEKELLKGLKEVEELERLENEKLEILKKLSQLDPSSFKGEEELLKEIQRLNSEVELLIRNALSLYEEVFEALFPERSATYSSKPAPTLFRGKA
jgi:hypothetical protein